MSDVRRVRMVKAAGLCAVVNPFVVYTLIALAIIHSPWFSWTENALSDLGVHGVAAVLFNSGLIAGGLLTLVFAAGLIASSSRLLGRVGVSFLAVTAVDLCAIGAFPETAGAIHFYFSALFFILLPVSLFIIGASMLQSRRRNLAVLTIIAGVVAAAVWTLPWGGAAIPETISSLAASFWTVALGVRLVGQPSAVLF